MNWDHHIKYIKQKVAKGIGIIIKARKTFNKETLTTLYHTMILPYLSYCIHVWGTASHIRIHGLFYFKRKLYELSVVFRQKPILCHFLRRLEFSTLPNFISIRLDYLCITLVICWYLLIFLVTCLYQSQRSIVMKQGKLKVYRHPIVKLLKAKNQFAILALNYGTLLVKM